MFVSQVFPGHADGTPVPAADFPDPGAGIVRPDCKIQRLLVILFLQLDFGHVLQQLGILWLDSQCAFDVSRSQIQVTGALTFTFTSRSSTGAGV
jgi:hypothetical protein